MAQIRETIELLCTILSSNGTTKIKAETFRQAKFNQIEATSPLWRLLFEMFYLCKYGTIDEVPTKAAAQLSPEEIVVYVKRELQNNGFVSQEFSSLPNDMSYGSRELLLAFGWLLCRENIIERFMMTRGLEIGEDTAMFHQNALLDEEKPSNNMKFPSSADPSEKIKYLLWLNGKLQMKMRQLHAMQRQKNKLSHQIHEATEGVSTSPDINHLSMMEVYLLRHPDALIKMMKLLDEDNERLRCLIKWRDHEDSFWKWMESVLDAKLSNREQSDDEPHKIPQSAASQMKQAHDRLQWAILRYETVVDHLETTVTLKSTDVSKEELDQLTASIERSINMEIDFQKSHKPITVPTAKPSYDPILKYQQQSSSKRASSQQNPKPSTSYLDQEESSTHFTQLSQELESLQDMLVSLQKNLETKQQDFKSDMLDFVSTRLQDGVCIPPMTVRTAWN